MIAGAQQATYSDCTDPFRRCYGDTYRISRLSIATMTADTCLWDSESHFSSQL